MFWVKHSHTDNRGLTYDVAQGPWETEAEAQAVIDNRQDADDPGVVVEGDSRYNRTLKHPVGYQADAEGVDFVVYSDGSTEALPPQE